MGTNNPNILVSVFLKGIRLVSLSHLYKELDELTKNLTELIVWIWKNYRRKCLCLGRELMRSLQEIYKIPDLKFISKDLAEIDPELGIELYQGLLQSKYADPNLTPESSVILQIPPFMEQYTTFILSSATKANFNKHLNWMFERMKIMQNSISEALIVDYIRYILIAAEEPAADGNQGDRIQRWLILGWLLKYIKNDFYKTLAKQALFFEWLYFDGNEENFKFFEPTWLMIVNSLNKYKEMSEELLDFLFLYAREYDSPGTTCEARMVKVFELIKKKHHGSLEMLADSENLNVYLRQKMQSLMSKEGGLNAIIDVGDYPSKSANKNGKGTAMDIEEGILNKGEYNPASVGHPSVGSGKKGEKMQEENLNSGPLTNQPPPDYIEIEHHHGGVSIFMKEKPYRPNSRGIILSRIAPTLPDFVVECSKFPEFQKNSSLINLSLLLNEIFHQGNNVASQTYNPILSDQLTQDQVLVETYNLISALFEQELKEDFNLKTCETLEQIFSKLIARNFDFDGDQYFLKGIGFFLFTKVARLHSENFNLYALMEKLLGQIFKHSPIIFIEFVIILNILKKREQGQHSEEVYKMRGVFVSLKYETLAEILRLSLSHVDDVSKLINDSLKFLFIQTHGNQLFIQLAIFFCNLISNDLPACAQASFLFLIKVLNANIACRFEIENLDNFSALFCEQLSFIMNKC